MCCFVQWRLNFCKQPLTIHQSNINEVENIILENDALYNQEPHTTYRTIS